MSGCHGHLSHLRFGRHAQCSGCIEQPPHVRAGRAEGDALAAARFDRARPRPRERERPRPRDHERDRPPPRTRRGGNGSAVGMSVSDLDLAMSASRWSKARRQWRCRSRSVKAVHCSGVNQPGELRMSSTVGMSHCTGGAPDSNAGTGVAIMGPEPGAPDVGTVGLTVR